MKIIRLNNKNNEKTKLPRRRKHYIKESDLISYAKEISPLNKQGIFTYNDFNRNKNSIEMIRHQMNQAIFNYGVDLQYFRKYNTFFKEGEENHANLIYGEDTTAEFYASGMIRAFVSIENMAWNFNQIGLEASEQINLYISIDNFEQTFEDKIAKTETKKFEVQVCRFYIK